MGKIAIPEQVKVARLSVKNTAAALEGYEIPMGLGEDEVAIVLGSLLSIRASDSAGLCQLWLYRKAEERIPDTAVITGWTNEDGDWQKDHAVFDYMKQYLTRNSEVGVYDRETRMYKVYPYPVCLIRDPSLLCYAGVATICFTAILWYMIQKVTDAELAQLMVKDHA